MSGTVTLRTGAEAPASVVRVVMLSLDKLMDTHPIAVYELAEACRDPQHVMFGRTGEVAAEIGLIELRDDGTAEMHDVTRDIILAATVPAGLDIELRDPVRPS